MRQGEVLGIVSTNALELGKGYWKPQAVITGYPGTIASFWQQVGRAGRKRELSSAVLVGNSSPLNQFIMNNPEFVIDQGAERALIDGDNLYILISHLKCGAFELPFEEGESFGEKDVAEFLDFLVSENILRFVGQRYYWMSDKYPAADVSLRSAATDNFAIIDITDGQSNVIGQVDRFSAAMLIHPGAIYMHESKQFHIDKLDWEGREGLCKASKG